MRRREARAREATIEVAVAALVAAVTLSWDGSAVSAEEFVLAASSKQKLQVIADDRDTWCSEDVRLRMVLEVDSPISRDPASQIAIMNKLRTPITVDCKASRKATVIVVDPGTTGQTVYEATADGGWAFAPVSSATTQVAAVLANDTAEPVKVPESASAPVAGTAEERIDADQRSPAADQALATPIKDAAPVTAEDHKTTEPTVPAAETERDGKPPALPRERGYISALFRAIRDKPSMVESEELVRFWAQYRFQKEHAKFRDNEFKIREIVERAREDLPKSVAAAESPFITVLGQISFGSYDFEKKVFPFSFNGTTVGLNHPCCFSAHGPKSFRIVVGDLEVLDGIPMEPHEAEVFAQRRTHYGSIDRNAYYALTIDLDARGFVNDDWAMSASGFLQRFALYSDREYKEPIYWLGQEALKQLRVTREAEKAVAAKLAAEREAERQRQLAEQKAERERQIAAQRAERERQIAAQQAERERLWVERQAELRRQDEERRRQAWIERRDRDIRSLERADASVRLANFISEGEVNSRLTLSRLRSARGAALYLGKPVRVHMLVQAEDAGRTDVATKWPGLLTITAAGQLPELKASGWYLVDGLLDVPADEGLAPAKLLAERIHQCSKPRCEDATDPTLIVDRKLAADLQGGQ
mgnify:CR=1 FL=1